MESPVSLGSSFLAILMLVLLCNLADCYDPLDPNGNITVTFDVMTWTDDGYEATVTIQNYYQYRHVEKPGWKMEWTWSKNEVIWYMEGALATQQGNCSNFKFKIPHSCMKSPVIVDLLPDALPINRFTNCCRGGVLAAWAVDPSTSFSAFNITVGNLGNITENMPQDLKLMAPGPGYTCSTFEDLKPTIFPASDIRRKTQALRTWKSTCTYSRFLANKAPLCCVSLSSFYNPTITPCPTCSCDCRPTDNSSLSCVRDDFRILKDRVAAPDRVNAVDSALVQCTDHMCRVRVHWHVKTNYRDHWRVKLTLTNYDYLSNYADWNIMVQHPGFSEKFTAYSFNSTKLRAIGDGDSAALFWGLKYFNDMLLRADGRQVGSVTSEILLRKDDKFTLRNGWAFPRRIYFNGENCEMPLPDIYPSLSA